MKMRFIAVFPSSLKTGFPLNIRFWVASQRSRMHQIRLNRTGGSFRVHVHMHGSGYLNFRQQWLWYYSERRPAVACMHSIQRWDDRER